MQLTIDNLKTKYVSNLDGENKELYEKKEIKSLYSDLEFDEDSQIWRGGLQDGECYLCYVFLLV